jgi:hypothetical protein
MQSGISFLSVLRVMTIGANRAVQPTIINVLKILLPTTLPIAMSALPLRAEETLTVSSGAEVPNATIVSPITIGGIYVLLKEVIDNSIDEFKMQAGKKIEIIVEENLRVSVRDYGRGIPQGKLIEAVSMLNTGGKYDSKAFKKSVGLNGVGVKAVNALSSRFEVRSYRDGKVRIATFSKGELLTDETQNTEEDNGTYIFFVETFLIVIAISRIYDSGSKDT